MKHLIGLVLLFIVQKWDAFDRWLCVSTPWYFRLWWHMLWIREDEFHPSLDSDYQALRDKLLFHERCIGIWQNVTRLRPVPTPKDFHGEMLTLLKHGRRIRKEYELNLVRRRDIAHRRDETLSLR